MAYQELLKHSIKGDQNAIKELLVYAKNPNKENKLLELWYESESLSLRPLPKIVEGMNKRFIFITVDYDIFHESDVGGRLWPLTDLLNSALDEANGVENSEDDKKDYAGATTPSRLACVMQDYFGIGDSVFSDNFENIKVRIWADILAIEVERRFLHTKTNNYSPE